MPLLKTYRLFISHSWTYGDAYEKLVNFLNEYSNFKWIDYSVPKNDPIHNAGSDKQLYEAIKRQIQPVHCVLIMAGVYSTYSKWINKEITISKQEFGKPIVAIEPWGSNKTSQTVKINADRLAKWQSASIVSAIREVSL